MGHLLDAHPALGGGDHRNPGGLAVHKQGEVEFLGDGGAFLDVEAVDLLALRAGLFGDQNATQHFLGGGLHIVQRLQHPNAALGVGAQALESAFAAPAGVDLRLHDPDRAAQLAGGFDRFGDREGGIPARNRDTELGEDGLGLMLVDVH